MFAQLKAEAEANTKRLLALSDTDPASEQVQAEIGRAL